MGSIQIHIIQSPFQSVIDIITFKLVQGIVVGYVLFIGFHIDLLRGVVVISRHSYRQQPVLHDLDGTGARRLRVVIGVLDIDGGGTVFRAQILVQVEIDAVTARGNGVRGVAGKFVSHQVRGEVSALAVSRSPFLSIFLPGCQIFFFTHIGRQCSLPHIFSRHTFHAHPRATLRIVGIVSEGDSHPRIRILLEEVHVQRRDAEMGIVIAFTQHGQVERIALLGNIDTGIERDVVRIVAHMSQPANDDVVGVMPVTHYLEVLHRILSEIEGVFGLDGGIILSCGQGRIAVVGGIVGFNRKIGGFAVFVYKLRFPPLFVNIIYYSGRILIFLRINVRVNHVLEHVEGDGSRLAVVVDNGIALYAYRVTVWVGGSQFGQAIVRLGQRHGGRHVMHSPFRY